MDIIDSIRNNLKQVIANCDAAKENMGRAKLKFAETSENMRRIAETCKGISK